MNQTWGRTLFWVVAVVLCAYALNRLSSILLPFVLGSAIAFLLDPFVNRLDRLRVPRSLGSVLVLFAFLALIVAFILLLVPLLETQIVTLVGRFPSYLKLARDELDQFLALLQDRLDPDQVAKLRDAASDKIGDILSGAGRLKTSVLTGGVAVANLLSLIFITPIVTFFLLARLGGADLDDRCLAAARACRHDSPAGVSDQSDLERLPAWPGLGLPAAGPVLRAGAHHHRAGFRPGAGPGLWRADLHPVPGRASAAACSRWLWDSPMFGTWHKPLAILILFVVGQTLEGNIITPEAGRRPGQPAPGAG